MRPFLSALFRRPEGLIKGRGAQAVVHRPGAADTGIRLSADDLQGFHAYTLRALYAHVVEAWRERKQRQAQLLRLQH